VTTAPLKVVCTNVALCKWISLFHMMAMIDESL